jgi:serine/threonine protein kinase
MESRLMPVVHSRQSVTQGSTQGGANIQVGAAKRLRFGAFELDLKAGELYSGRVRVRLQDQPLRVLLMLAERQGDVIAREEIKKKLWPNDTVVEFDASIAAAIRRLRKVLGDSAEQSTYVETVGRRGYRLIVSVVWLADENDACPSPRAEQPSDSAETTLLGSSGLIGRKVSHYRVLEVIGGGGMGLVYKAEDLRLGRSVALKFLPEELAGDPVALQRFEREARTASSLNHPNICSIFEFGEHEGQPFLVMELLEGKTLRDQLAELSSLRRTMLLDELVMVALQVAQGLEAAHERGIIHRDIKPANIFLTSKGPIKILDFGLAKLAEAMEEEQAAFQTGVALGDRLPELATEYTLTRTGTAMGTAGYMSPEQVRGEKLDSRTDLFSFGLVMYEMACGQRAFNGETTILRDSILHHTPPSVRELNPAVSSKLEKIVEKAIKKDRAERYQSALEMCADLKAVDDSRPVRSRMSLAITGLAVMLLLAAGAGYLRYRERAAARLTAADTVVLADFSNETSDPVFDGSLNSGLRVELMQTPFLNILARDKIRGTLKLMGQPEAAKLTPDLARQVCLRTNSKVVVAGSIADAGIHYRIMLRALDCQSGRSLTVVETEATERNQVVEMLGIAGYTLRQRLGEPKDSLQRFHVPLQVAMTSSLEAVHSFALFGSGGQNTGAIASRLRAVELDPNFAWAYEILGVDYYNVGELSLAVPNLRKAYDLRSRMTLSYRFATEAFYHLKATGELEKALEDYRDYAQPTLTITSEE